MVYRLRQLGRRIQQFGKTYYRLHEVSAPPVKKSKISKPDPNYRFEYARAGLDMCNAAVQRSMKCTVHETKSAQSASLLAVFDKSKVDLTPVQKASPILC